MKVIEVEGLTKRYGDLLAVDSISLEVERGEIFGILGPNGAGKTTTVECIQGLRPFDVGRVRVLGLDPRSQQRELRRRIGSQLQESALPDRMKVWEALDLFSSVGSNHTDWVALLDTWGLESLSDRSFAALSGGQRQRLFIALALVNDPEIVFLDELTQGLDPSARRVAWELIRAVRQQGTTVVLVTHHMDEVEQLCDRVAIISEGHVIASGTPSQLVADVTVNLTVRFSTDAADLSWLGDVAHVVDFGRRGRNVEVVGTGPVLALVAAALVERGILPEDLRAERASFEDAYLLLTSSESGGPP